MLIGARTAEWSGVTKPYKARLEYLSNDGSGRHIDTGIYWQLGDTAQIVTAADVEADQAAFGVMYRLYGFNNKSPRAFYWANAPLAGGSDYALPSEYGTSKHTITINESSCTVDETTIFGTETFATTQSLHTIPLFARINNSTSLIYNKYYNGKIYEWKYWRQGELIQHLIPVLDNSDVACMYDEVTGAFFYNSGTGSFTAGPVVDGGGYKLTWPPRSHRRSSRPSARFWRTSQWKEVA